MNNQHALHEDFDHEDKVRIGPPRVFGFVFGFVFACIAVWPIFNQLPIAIWPVVVSSIFFVIAIFTPTLLNPLNRMWFRFGLLLHKVVNPIVMGLLFFVTVTPIAIIFKIIGKDPLHRGFDPDQTSYWIKRDPQELSPGSMKNQF